MARRVISNFLRECLQGLLNFRQSIQQKSAFFAAADDTRISAGTFATWRM